MDDADEAAARAYVSALWAEDWDSPEDSAYDPPLAAERTSRSHP